MPAPVTDTTSDNINLLLDEAGDAETELSEGKVEDVAEIKVASLSPTHEQTRPTAHP